MLHPPPTPLTYLTYKRSKNLLQKFQTMVNMPEKKEVGVELKAETKTQK